jgi:hypothetical protein
MEEVGRVCEGGVAACARDDGGEMLPGKGEWIDLTTLGSSDGSVAKDGKETEAPSDVSDEHANGQHLRVWPIVGTVQVLCLDADGVEVAVLQGVALTYVKRNVGLADELPDSSVLGDVVMG